MILDFLITYWKELAYGVVALVTILITLFRKRGKVDPVLDKILQIAPLAICDAERCYGAGHGDLKKSMVMGLLANTYKSLTGYELKEGCALYRTVSDFVENILKTPERKKER